MRGVLTVVLIVFFIDSVSGWLDGKWKLLAIGFSLSLLVWKMQDHFYRIAAAFFGVLLVVTLATLLIPGVDPERTSRPRAFKLEKGHPSRVIHLVLDEHIGIEGIPTQSETGLALKERTQRFFDQYGFQLFANSYSRYDQTLDSLPNLVNFAAGNGIHSLISGEGRGGSVLKNSYFQQLGALGFGVSVWESSFLSFCADQTLEFESCKEYTPWDTRVMQRFELSLSDQVSSVFASYIKSSYLHSRMRKLYVQTQRTALRAGIRLPKWSWDTFPNMSTLNAIEAMDEVWRDILSLPPGNVLFAHLLYPHRPYATRSDCSINKELLEWGAPDDLSADMAREQNYELYFRQVNCLYSKLEELFAQMQAAKIWDDSLIIVQGDHGSRLNATRPDVDSEQEFTDRDLVDSYSTLFAVRIPGSDGFYDTRTVAMEELLSSVTLDFLTAGRPLTLADSPPYVFREIGSSGDSGLFEKIPYPGAVRQD
jgi:hypothetical protein